MAVSGLTTQGKHLFELLLPSWIVLLYFGWYGDQGYMFVHVDQYKNPINSPQDNTMRWTPDILPGRYY